MVGSNRRFEQDLVPQKRDGLKPTVCSIPQCGIGISFRFEAERTRPLKKNKQLANSYREDCIERVHEKQNILSIKRI
ncbi:MAG: hypothetical protein HZB59_02170 [Ignavibacteriales bacterium]|nr:hypothetical protein [Ignavibacteriales bacterium]